MPKNRKRIELENVVLHDLRRTGASIIASLGTSRLVVSKLLNHVETHVTAVYDRHSYDGEKRDALQAWGDHLEQILFIDRSRAANVMRLPHG